MAGPQPYLSLVTRQVAKAIELDCDVGGYAERHGRPPHELVVLARLELIQFRKAPRFRELDRVGGEAGVCVSFLIERAGRSASRILSGRQNPTVTTPNRVSAAD